MNPPTSYRTDRRRTGCVRLHPGNAAMLFAGEPRGLANTAIMITGANPGFAKRRWAQAE
jgi:hypothetical protein